MKFNILILRIFDADYFKRYNYPIYDLLPLLLILVVIFIFWKFLKLPNMKYPKINVINPFYKSRNELGFYSNPEDCGELYVFENTSHPIFF